MIGWPKVSSIILVGAVSSKERPLNDWSLPLRGGTGVYFAKKNIFLAYSS